MVGVIADLQNSIQLSGSAVVSVLPDPLIRRDWQARTLTPQQRMTKPGQNAEATIYVCNRVNCRRSENVSGLISS